MDSLYSNENMHRKHRFKNRDPVHMQALYNVMQKGKYVRLAYANICFCEKAKRFILKLNKKILLLL